jgi:transcription elongation factor Elf1
MIMTTKMNTIYKTAKCGCNIEINAVYNEVEGYIEVYDVYIVKACDDHRPDNSPEYELENDELEDDWNGAVWNGVN